MRKRRIDKGAGLLEEAREALGTESVRDAVARTQLTEDDLVDFAEATADLRKPEVIATAWR